MVGFVGFEFGFGDVALDGLFGIGSAEEVFLFGLSGFVLSVSAGEAVRFDRFVVEMEGHEGLAPGGPLVEVWVEGEAGKFAFEVNFVFGAVGRMVEDGVGVVEDVFFGDFWVAVVGLEFG